MVGAANPKAVRAMFDRIAPTYDRLNRIITFGRDDAWRRRAVDETMLPAGGSLLDLGAGTGRIASLASRRIPDARIVAADFSRGMMEKGRSAADAPNVAWLCADALALPFPDGSFDGVVSGYLVRNVADPSAAFREQARVVKTGGRVVCLETSTSRVTALAPVVKLYLSRVLPALGGLLASDRAAYTYLPKTAEAFLSPEQTAAVMEAAGLRVVGIARFMLGTQAVISAEKR